MTRYLEKAIYKSNLRVCSHCGCTYGSHCGGAYFSEMYGKRIPKDYCPGNEGRMDWDKSPGTTFEWNGKYKEKETKDANVSKM